MTTMLLYLPGLLLLLIVLGWCLAPWRAVARARISQRKASREENAESKESESAEDTDAPLMLSVVALVWGNEENPADFIEEFMAQSYPKKELILVADASAESAALLAEQYAAREGVYLTFVPSGCRNVSRRKLGAMIGIKAAKGDVVLLTSTNCRPRGRNWLADMMAPFSDEKVEIVIGEARFDPSEMRGGAGRRMLRRLNLDSLRWLGAACLGKPYRGSAFNLAYRRQLFFDHKGFSGSIGFENGDDDIFIAQSATGANTRVVVSPDAVVTEEWGDEALRIAKSQQAAYAKTQVCLPKMPFVRSATLAAALWILAALTLACGAWLALTLTGIIPDDVYYYGSWRHAAMLTGLYAAALIVALAAREATLRIALR